MAYLTTVCDVAEQRCPTVWPGALKRMSWPFDDPQAFRGTTEQRAAKFREARDQIEARIVAWLDETDSEQS